MKHFSIITIALTALIIAGCESASLPTGSGGGQVMDGDGMMRSFDYKQISQDEAKRIMEEEKDYVIVDVRREDEYAEGHIPGAILIPNESIVEYEPPEELNNSDQIILVYCRSGRRSKEAAEKLAKMGFSQVYEFGGIIDWTGDVVKGDTQVDNQEDMTPSGIMVIRVGDMCFSIDMENNTSAAEFTKMVNKGGLTLEMHDYGDFEKVGDLPWELPTNDEEITTRPGDLILYQGNKITVYYDENTWNFTKLGHLNAEPEEIKETFGGKDNITAEFFVEWTE